MLGSIPKNEDKNRLTKKCIQVMVLRKWFSFLAAVTAATLLLAGCDRLGSDKTSSRTKDPKSPPPGNTLVPPKQLADPWCPDSNSDITMYGDCVTIGNSGITSRDDLVRALQAFIDTDALVNNQKCWVVYLTALEHIQDRDVPIRIFPESTRKLGNKMYGFYAPPDNGYSFGYGWNKAAVTNTRTLARKIIHEVAHYQGFSHPTNQNLENKCTK